MNWDRLKYFYYTAKIGNFTKTAKLLNTSQSALSRRISLLEKDLKIKLFTRHYGGLNLTETGKIWFHNITKIFSEIEKAKRLTEERKKTLSGNITIYSTADVIHVLLLKNIKNFTKLFPNIKIKVINKENMGSFSQGIEIAISPYIPERPDLIQKYLGTAQLKLFASREYLKQHGIPKTPQDLDHHKLITYGSHNHPFSNINWLLSVGRKEGTIREPYMQLNQPENIINLAKQGLGIVTLRDKRGKEEGLVQILPELKTPSIDFMCIYPEYLKHSRYIKILKYFLKERAKEEYKQKE